MEEGIKNEKWYQKKTNIFGKSVSYLFVAFLLVGLASATAGFTLLTVKQHINVSEAFVLHHYEGTNPVQMTLDYGATPVDLSPITLMPGDSNTENFDVQNNAAADMSLVVGVDVPADSGITTELTCATVGTGVDFQYMWDSTAKEFHIRLGSSSAVVPFGIKRTAGAESSGADMTLRFAREATPTSGAWNNVDCTA